MSSSQPFRLSAGGRIDRSKPLSFHFDGKAYEGFEGDTLASALLANGVRIAGRSFRYHRPRGIFAAGAEEPGIIVKVGSGASAEPNLSATEVRLREGLEARSVNAWPSARFDLGAVTNLFSPFLTAGFYYKTFMWPRWSLFSGTIRRMGGLGKAPREPDAARYEHLHEACDVLVVGAGPAGLCAALSASDPEATVVLADSQSECGGSLLGDTETIDDQSAVAWTKEAVAKLNSRENVTLLPGHSAFGYYDHNTVGLIAGTGEHQTLRSIRARHVVLTTGAFERPLVFRNNDRPNIMLASAVRTYLHRYGVLAGRTVVIATNNDSAYPLALELAAQGATVAAVADARTEVPTVLAQSLETAGIHLFRGWTASNTTGRRAISAVEIAEVGNRGGKSVRIACDLLCVSGGWNPAVHLFSQSGGSLRYEPDTQCFVPDISTQQLTIAGAANGAFSLASALREGTRAGTRAAREAGFETREGTSPVAIEPRSLPPRAQWKTADADSGRAWVDLLNDVTSADIQQAATENYRSVEHLKRYTTLGMAVDQGKTSNVSAIGILSTLLDKPPGDIGTTRFRPPFTPVRLGALTCGRSGRFYHPLKLLPAHRAHVERSAVMEDYGGWERPAFYPLDDEDEESAIRREALAVRRNVGVFDASPLGKIRVAGRDAAEFLDRVYVNTMKTLKPGRCRYGIMLGENGIVFDDGVLLRVSEDEFLVGTTSPHAGAVTLWLEEWLQCEWTSLQVALEDVTSQWATTTIAGPKSLALLQALGIDGPLTDLALPHMAFCDSAIGSAPCRVARVSFTGERSYEVSVPAEFGEALWRRCLALGGLPVGLEATMRLRMEKGFLHIGSDTDGTTYPQDIGYAPAMAKKKGDFIGRRSTTLPEALRAGRRQLVGLEPMDTAQPVVAGSHLVDSHGRSEGWVTSAGYSPVLGRHVALAMVNDGHRRIGEQVTLHNLGARSMARLCVPRFYDIEGTRLHA